jgi:hypothetical protein
MLMTTSNRTVGKFIPSRSKPRSRFGCWSRRGGGLGGSEVTSLGNRLRMQVQESERSRVRVFFQAILGCTRNSGAGALVDAFRFEDGFKCDVFYVPRHEALAEEAFVRATWLELMTNDTATLVSRLRQFGVLEIAYADKSHYFFQAPGGQVFRVADEAERLEAASLGRSHDRG